MKKLKILACGSLLLCSGMLFAGCKDEIKNFNVDKILVSNQKVEYNEDEQVFNVSYAGKDVDVTYSIDNKATFVSKEDLNFVNVGKHTVYYKLSKKGYKDFVSGPVEFEITEKKVNIDLGVITDYIDEARTSQELIAELQEQFPAYNIAFSVEEYNTNATGVYTISATENEANYNIVVKGKYCIANQISIVEGDDVNPNLTSLQDAIDAAEDGAIIQLNKDVEATEDIVIDATSKAYNLTIDLNGHNFNKGFKVIANENSAQTKNAVNLTIKNSQQTQSVVGSESSNGLFVKGNDLVQINLSNIHFKGSNTGISTNGLTEFKGATINATDCSFGGKYTASGAYLPGWAVYKFNNCSFEGLTGYYTKSGRHTLTNCDVYGNQNGYTLPTYNPNGCNETGSALIAESSYGYFEELRVNIDGGTYKSKAGFCVEELRLSETGKAVIDYTTVNLVSVPTFVLEDGNEKTETIILIQNQQ